MAVISSYKNTVIANFMHNIITIFIQSLRYFVGVIVEPTFEQLH